VKNIDSIVMFTTKLSTQIVKHREYLKIKKKLQKIEFKSKILLGDLCGNFLLLKRK